MIERGDRRSAWHNLGQEPIKPGEVITVREAFIRAHIDEMTVSLGHSAGWVWSGPDGKQVLLDGDGHSIIVRSPTKADPQPRRFGSPVLSNYALMQPLQLADSLEALNMKWPLETALALGQGETIIATFRAEDDHLPGEPREAYRTYYVVSDTRDGKSATRLGLGKTRVVCENTFRRAMGNGRVISLVHTEKTADRVRWISQMIVDAGKMREEFWDHMVALFKTQVDDEDIERILLAAYPKPKLSHEHSMMAGLSPDELGKAHYAAKMEQFKARMQAHESATRLAEAKRTSVRHLLAMEADTAPWIAGTAYAVVQAVGEQADHYGNGDLVKMATSSLFGTAAQTKDRAMREALAIANYRD